MYKSFVTEKTKRIKRERKKDQSIHMHKLSVFFMVCVGARAAAATIGSIEARAHTLPHKVPFMTFVRSLTAGKGTDDTAPPIATLSFPPVHPQ